ncbi:MAG: DNA repair protein RecO [Flavobacteriaceae bacterium]|nr:DNA repair protein RecO [Flavobacteriaceae bacterium]
MINKTNAIVLSRIKYRDNDIIVKCFTEKDGLASYLLRGLLKSKKGNKTAYFQPLSQIEIVQSFKENQSLRSIREIKPVLVYKTLHTDIKKVSIAMFLSEVLYIVLQEEESNLELYRFLETSFQLLDEEVDYSNFHLLFLLKLTRFLGFYPNTSNINAPFFNIEKGIFEQEEKTLYSVSGKNLSILKTLLGTNFEALWQLQLSAAQRQSFLTMLFLYFDLHLGNFRKPQSLEVFTQVFK